MGRQWLPLHALFKGGGLKERVQPKNFACSFNGTHLFVCTPSTSKKMFLCFLVPSITGQRVGDGAKLRLLTASSDRQVFNPSIASWGITFPFEWKSRSRWLWPQSNKATKQQNNKNRNRKSKQKPKPKKKPKATDRRGGYLGQPAALKLEKEIMNINVLYLGSVTAAAVQLWLSTCSPLTSIKNEKKRKNRCDQS